MKISGKTWAKVIVVGLYVIIGLIIPFRLTDFSDTYIKDNNLNFSKYSKIVEIIDTEKDFSSKIKDLLVISDEQQIKNESSNLNTVLANISDKFDGIKKNTTNSEEKQIIDDILNNRRNYLPIQNKIIEYFKIQPKANELVILYGDLTKTQKGYIEKCYQLSGLYKKTIEDTNSYTAFSFLINEILYYIFLILSLVIAGYVIYIMFFPRKENNISESNNVNSNL